MFLVPECSCRYNQIASLVILACAGVYNCNHPLAYSTQHLRSSTSETSWSSDQLPFTAGADIYWPCALGQVT